jgi:type VI secretion system protein ImpH
VSESVEAPAVPTAPALTGAERVARALREDATGFSFFQVVRLLGLLRPDRAAVGEWADPADEIARFGVHSSLGFPASEIQTLMLPDAEADEAARVVVNFFGLTGPQGVLPHVYTEHAAVRARAKDTAFRDFLDLFHHRALSLFYRAWERNRFSIAAEAGREDRLFEHLLDLGGVGTTGLRDRLPVRDQALAFYGGLLAMRSRPADGLGRLIGDYFDVDATVEQFIGEWRRVGQTGQCTIGGDDAAGQLGFGIIGDAAWDAQARVRLRLGPLTREQFDAFLPGGAEHEPLRALARLYADEQVGVEAQLVLAREAVLPCVLGATVAPSMLGRGTWLTSRAPQRDPDDTVLVLC